MRETANPKVIKWALDRCHKTPGELRNTVSPRVQQWIDGEGKPPTPKQLENLAKATHVLVPYFYEDDVPDLPLQIPDYRTLDASAPINPSPELYDVINQTLSRQDWLSGYLEDSGEDPSASSAPARTAATGRIAPQRCAPCSGSAKAGRVARRETPQCALCARPSSARACTSMPEATSPTPPTGPSR